jgi:SAM (Sterile alpha motif) domain-containing protein
MDVGVWLRSLGLGRYEVAFSENSIDADVLPDLTEGDLEKLGVTLGDRKRLLKAMAGLGATEPAAKPTSPAPLSSSTDSAERRPITVMFCDLVGSTSLAAKLDAEDWRTLVNAYLDEASAAVTGLGGHVLKKLGDGLMALFGYAHAQENDAERAGGAASCLGHGRMSRRRGEKHRAVLPSRGSQELLDEKYGARTLTANKLSKILNCHFLNEASFETPALATSTTSRSSTMRRTSNASFYGPSAVARSAAMARARPPSPLI